jgi:hypothetical protein
VQQIVQSLILARCSPAPVRQPASQLSCVQSGLELAAREDAVKVSEQTVRTPRSCLIETRPLARGGHGGGPLRRPNISGGLGGRGGTAAQNESPGGSGSVAMPGQRR